LAEPVSAGAGFVALAESVEEDFSGESFVEADLEELDDDRLSVL
jgi:hypothetical protein